MEQLSMLWEFQQEDMKTDAMANDIRRNPKRLQMEKDRDRIQTLQKDYTDISEQLAEMADRYDVITVAHPRCEEQLSQLIESFEANPTEDLDEVQSRIAQVEELTQTIANFETEMRYIRKESTERANRQVSIRRQAAGVKQEFTKLKAEYEQERAGEKTALEQQKAAAAEKAKGIDQELMDHYLQIKKHVSPPMAKLYGDQCSGCNTSLPSALLQKLRSGNEVYECETCGRMLIP